jgi:EmrB/QacA subfamily drug resistance transporter
MRARWVAWLSNYRKLPRRPGPMAERIGVPAPGRAGAARLHHGAGLALGIIATCQLMLVIDATILTIAVPRIQSSLHLTVDSLSWAVNSYTLTFGGLLLLGGRAGDLWGRRRVLTAGVLLFAVASLAGSLATSGAWLFSARAAQGVGAAMASPAALALIATNFTEGPVRNRALGVYGAASGVGMALGLVLGGMLTSWASWRWVLVINFPPGMAVALLAPLALKESPLQPGRFDLAGAVTSSAGAAALVYGFIRASSASWSDPLTVAAFLAGAALLGTFVVVETHARQPIAPLHLITDRSRAAAFGIRLLLTAAMSGMMFMLTLFVQDVWRFSPLLTGFAFLPSTVASVTAARLAPRWLTQVGSRPLMVSGAALTTGGMVWLSQAPSGTSYPAGLLGPVLLFGFGFSLLFVAVTYVVMAGVRPEEAGAASGLLNSMQQIGGALGVAAMVTVAGGAVVAQAQLHRAGLAAGVGRAFTLGIFLTVGVLMLTLVPARRRPAADPVPKPIR